MMQWEAYQWVEDLCEVSGCVVGWGTPGRHNRAERNIGLVNLGLTEEPWAGGAGGCRGLEITVRWCVDGLRLVERPELVGDLAFDGWDEVS